MRPETVVALLAEPTRLRVFSAVVLGASSLPEVAGAAGTSAKEASVALRRLCKGGLVDETEDGFRCRTEHFRDIVRETRPVEPLQTHGYQDDQVEFLLRTFVRDDRLVKLPAQWGRRRIVLQHLTHRSFEEGVSYDERAVNSTLKQWCEGAETDHVTVRRYLIDLCLLGRADGRYWLRTDIQPAL